MNGNNSLERRYSFNIAQGIPMAESTQLNGSGFSWGSVSPKVGSSSIYKSPSSSSSYISDEIIANPRSVHLSKIDARIAADVQSKGLASRIVKYQESGTRLNRSMSAHNLFSKPGQFPAVTLKKCNLPFRAAKRELSMIRIPPPDKSSFYGNTVSSLLRSSSVIGLQSKQNEDVSTENRPIIHPPPTENDMAPTRSVLDVLKEISRKRINSDELESAETSKKYCSRARNDFVDAVVDKKSAIQENYLASLASPAQRYKRQRDCITTQQSVNFVETKTSPEQAKKRICNYNNDITSSLSSSIKCKKVATYQNPNQTLPTNFQLTETQNSKEHHHSFDQTKINSKNVDMRFKNLENNWKNPETHNHITTHESEASAGPGQNNSAVACQRSSSDPSFNATEKIANGSGHTMADKPRLTLFNKKFDDSENKEESKTCELEEKKDDCAGIPFVKPKKIASNSGLRNPVMERTKKSKLALMLSGLRGELYQNSALDEVDTAREKKKETPNTLTSPAKTANSTPTLTTVTSTTTVASTSTVETPTNVKTTVSSSSSPLVGLKLKSPTENLSHMLSAKDTVKNTSLQSQSSVPVLAGFPLGATSSTSTSTIQSSSNLQIESKSTPAQIPTIPLTSSTETPKTPITLFTSSDKMSEISEKPPSATNKNVIQFPAVCTAATLTTSNANSATTANTLTAAKNFTYVSNLTNSASTTTSSPWPTNNFQVNVTSSSPSAVSSTPIVFATPTASTANKTNGFNFSIPSATSQIATVPSSAPPIVFGVSTNSANLTTTTSTASVSAVKPSAVEHKIVNSPQNPFNPASAAGLSNFNTQLKSSTNEMQNSTLSFNINANKTASSANAFAVNSNNNNNNTMNFKFDAKSYNFGDQGNQKTESKAFNSGSPLQFGSESLNTKAMGSPISVFGNGTSKSDNSIFNPSALSSIFAPKSDVKGGVEVAASNSSSKPEVLATPTGGFSSDKINTNKSTPFSFVSNTTAFAAPSSTNVNTQAGGFSFSSAISNSTSESRPSGKSESLNHTFSSASPSQNNFMFGPATSNKLGSSNIFGVSASKPENVSQGGFSFGVVTPIKTPTFTFGADKTPKNDVANASSSSTGFSFGTPADTKQNALSTNKPFSFGSPQPVQPKQADSRSVGNSFNIFGSPVASKPAQPAAFNFTSGSVQPNAATNIFAPPNLNVTTGPGDRPIRRATRRLQK